MRDPDQPLGCFQQMAYGLLGLGLYLFCSTVSCCGLWRFMIFLRVNPQNTTNEVPYNLEDWSFLSALPISFLFIGPILVILYVLYLRDIRVIQVKDRVTQPMEKEKRKKI